MLTLSTHTAASTRRTLWGLRGAVALGTHKAARKRTAQGVRQALQLQGKSRGAMQWKRKVSGCPPTADAAVASVLVWTLWRSVGRRGVLPLMPCSRLSGEHVASSCSQTARPENLDVRAWRGAEWQ